MTLKIRNALNNLNDLNACNLAPLPVEKNNRSIKLMRTIKRSNRFIASLQYLFTPKENIFNIYSNAKSKVKNMLSSSRV